MKKTYALLILFLLPVFVAANSYAGGPLGTCSNGKMIVYGSSSLPLQYSPDLGGLGNLSNAEAASLVDEAFAVWGNVGTSAITFQNAGSLSEDVVASNFNTYDNANDGINPIIFDEDGSIIDSLYGSGASDGIIGFAGSMANEATCEYTEGMALLNGRFTSVFNYEQFRATFVHEFGHFFGLDHCQINSSFAGNGDTSDDIYIPTMFPTATDDDTALGNLNPDDEAALTMLYPVSDSVTNATYGKIKGTVTWDTGGAVLGANVVAMKTDDQFFTQFSSVSDYFRQNTGEFEMLVLPGTYKLMIEPINTSFTGGSSVGPYSGSLWDESFTNPVLAAGYGSEVTVAAGQTVSNIDFIAQPGGGSSCAASYMLRNSPGALQALRVFRDTVLSRSSMGRTLVRLYYQHGDAMLKAVSSSSTLQKMCSGLLQGLLQ